MALDCYDSLLISQKMSSQSEVSLKFAVFFFFLTSLQCPTLDLSHKVGCTISLGRRQERRTFCLSRGRPGRHIVLDFESGAYMAAISSISAAANGTGHVKGHGGSQIIFAGELFLGVSRSCSFRIAFLFAFGSRATATHHHGRVLPAPLRRERLRVTQRRLVCATCSSSTT